MAAPERSYRELARFRSLDLTEASILVDAWKLNAGLKVTCVRQLANGDVIKRTSVPYLDHKRGMTDALNNLRRHMIAASEIIVFERQDISPVEPLTKTNT